MQVPPKFFLFKRKNGVYYVCFEQDGKPRWKSTGCKQKTEALRCIADLPDLIKHQLPKINLACFRNELTLYLQATHARTTVVLFKLALSHLIGLAGDTMMSSINARHVDHYKAARRKVVGAHSVNRELRTLRAAFNIALRWQYVESNPFGGVKQLRTPEARPCFLTKSDFDRLLSVIGEGWLKEMVIFSVSTGVRQSEMLNLKWQDVDLDRKLIHIQSSGDYRTKQGKRRTIPMNETVYVIFRSKLNRSTGEYVFNRNGFPRGGSFVTHRFKAYVRLAELDERLHWHSLRHTHASWLVQTGVSLYEVQKLLGHSSSKITEIYSHLQPENLHNTVNRIAIRLN
jgi:integrase